MIDWNERITPHFTRRELGSPDTGEVRYAAGFLDSLEALRVDVDLAMAVTSGCRSPAYNQRLVDDPRYQASPTSLHMFSNPKWAIDACAVDVACTDPMVRHALIAAATARGFSVGVHPRFLHLDDRTTFAGLPAAIFLYSSRISR